MRECQSNKVRGQVLHFPSFPPKFFTHADWGQVLHFPFPQPIFFT